VNEKSFTGGFFTLTAICTILTVVIASIVQFGTSNLTTKSTINPGVPDNQVVQFIDVSFFAYSGTNYTDCSQITSTFVGLDEVLVSFTSGTDPEGNPGCATVYSCTNCNIDFGRDVYMLFTFPNNSFVAAFNVNLTIPFFNNKKTLLGANIVPPSVTPAVFHSGITEFIALLTPAQYTTINNVTSLAFLLQFGSIIPGNVFSGDLIDNNSIIPPSEDDPLAFQLTFQQSSITFAEEEVEKSTILNFISQLLALAGGAISFWQIIMRLIEHIMTKLNVTDPAVHAERRKTKRNTETDIIELDGKI